MPDLAPFRGLRYAPPAATRPDGADLTRVTAPPYDVIDAAERAALLSSHPNNAVRLILPSVPDPGDDARDAYEHAAATLALWRATGVLRPDPEPALYAYRMEAPRAAGGVHRTLGAIGALALPDDIATGDVLPHERTLPKARTDRLALLRATRANFDPIWGLTLSVGLTDLLDDVPVAATAVDPEGVRHELGVVSDPERIGAIRALIGQKPVVLADGHHRFETACTYRAEHPTPGADAILALVVELDDEQLDVRPFHRLVRGAPADLRDRLAGSFAVRDAGAATTAGVARVLDEMAATEALGLVDATGVAVLAPKREAVADSLARLPAALRDVDAARFDVTVKPLLGADASLGYRNDADAVASAVNEGLADAAILLRGVGVEQIRNAADARVRMPEKTTYFAPKPRTGMVMRALDD